MPPKKSTDKVTKSTPRKGRASSNASPPKASPTKNDARANQTLLFLWSCLQSTQAKVDLKAVAEEWGLNTTAARMRLTRLGVYIAKVREAEQSEKGVRTKGVQQDENGDGDGSNLEEIENWPLSPKTLKERLLADNAFSLEG